MGWTFEKIVYKFVGSEAELRVKFRVYVQKRSRLSASLLLKKLCPTTVV